MTISRRMLPITPHIYAGGTLDRVSQRRADAAWIANAWRQPTAQVAPLWRGRCLQTLLPAVWAESLIASHDLPWALLGLKADTPVFTLDLSPLDQPPEPAGPFVDLRATTPLLAPGQAALLAYARALLEWRRRARFCGECGAPTRVEQAGHVTACTACGVRFFPRTDPTVIMLVTHGDRALLGHNARFPVRRMYSTLAGFVEPGESLEQAVAREVMEEAGIGLGTMRYHSSQPWPFPANLMLGFHAEAVTEDITVDAEELLDARWFSRAELRDPAAHGFELPPTFSIAYRLIDSWLVG